MGLTKLDLDRSSGVMAQATEAREEAGERVLPISAVSGAGLDALLNFLSGAVAAQRAEEKSKGEPEQADEWGTGGS